MRQPQIDARSLNARMTEQVAEKRYIRIPLQKLYREEMPKRMRMGVIGWNTVAFGMHLQHLPNPSLGEPVPSCINADEIRCFDLLKGRKYKLRELRGKKYPARFAFAENV